MRSAPVGDGQRDNLPQGLFAVLCASHAAVLYPSETADCQRLTCVGSVRTLHACCKMHRWTRNTPATVTPVSDATAYSLQLVNFSYNMHAHVVSRLGL